jgi:hypothetical protein
MAEQGPAWQSRAKDKKYKKSAKIVVFPNKIKQL